jgi:hypothetical protein
MAITGKPMSIHIEFKSSSRRRNPAILVVTTILGRAIPGLCFTALELLVHEDAALSLVNNIHSRYVFVLKN